MVPHGQGFEPLIGCATFWFLFIFLALCSNFYAFCSIARFSPNLHRNTVAQTILTGEKGLKRRTTFVDNHCEAAEGIIMRSGGGRKKRRNKKESFQSNLSLRRSSGFCGPGNFGGCLFAFTTLLRNRTPVVRVTGGSTTTVLSKMVKTLRKHLILIFSKITSKTSEVAERKGYGPLLPAILSLMLLSVAAGAGGRPSRAALPAPPISPPSRPRSGGGALVRFLLPVQQRCV